MLKTNIEHSFEHVYYIQIGYEIEGIFSGIVIDNTEILYINENRRIIDKDEKSHEYEKKLNKIIEKLEELDIYMCPIEQEFKIRDYDMFEKKYLKHLFNDDIVWMDSSNDILEMTINKKNEYQFLLSMLEKIDNDEYKRIKEEK